MFSSVGASSSDESTGDSTDASVTCMNSLSPSKKKVTKRKQPLQDNSSASSEASSEEDMEQSAVIQSNDTQSLILAELKKLGKRLDRVESKVEDSQKASSHHHRDNAKLSTSCSSKKSVKHCKKVSYDDSSSEEDNVLTVSELRASKRIQKKVDEKLAELDEIPKVKGNETVKSKRGGGGIEVVVKNKISWPHEIILGGPSRQRLTYDQMSLTQFVQGFTRNILEEKDGKIKASMVRYLGELMEDATDFSWSNAKAAHAVLLCDMERGILNWGDTEKIDRIRRAHAQKHQNSKQPWGKSTFDSKKPWFCKQYQTNSCTFNKDHESFGKTQKHICAFCLSIGKTLNHPECECRLKKANAKTHKQLLRINKK